MVGPTGLINDNFTITQPNVADNTTYQVNFFNPSTGQPDKQTLNGTYTVTLASGTVVYSNGTTTTIADANGNALDTNLNAGLYEFRGSNPYSTAVPTVFNAPIPGGGVAINGTTTEPATIPNTLLVPISVPDSFLVQQGLASAQHHVPVRPRPDGDPARPRRGRQP